MSTNQTAGFNKRVIQSESKLIQFSYHSLTPNNSLNFVVSHDEAFSLVRLSISHRLRHCLSSAKKLVLSFYKKHNPGFDTAKADKLILQHEGKEASLFCKLEEKYGEAVNPSNALQDAIAIRDGLRNPSPLHQKAMMNKSPTFASAMSSGKNNAVTGRQGSIEFVGGMGQNTAGAGTTKLIIDGAKGATSTASRRGSVSAGSNLRKKSPSKINDHWVASGDESLCMRCSSRPCACPKMNKADD